MDNYIFIIGKQMKEFDAIILRAFHTIGKCLTGKRAFHAIGKCPTGKSATRSQWVVRMRGNDVRSENKTCSDLVTNSAAIPDPFLWCFRF